MVGAFSPSPEVTMYVVAGVTGHTGAATAEALLSNKQPVRVVVRTAAKGEPWKKKGAEVAVGDLADPAFLARAVAGAKGVYVLSPPDLSHAQTAKGFLDDRLAFATRVVEGLKAGKVVNVVLLSSVGAQHAAGTGPIVTAHRFENLLRGQFPSVTFVRASYFIDNWAGLVGVAKKDGVLPNFGPTTFTFHQVASTDIGAAVAHALQHPADGTKVVELAGKEDWSVDDVAATLGSLLGREVKAMANPTEAAGPAMVAMGMPAGMAELYGEMYASMGKGLMAFEHPASVTRGTTSLRDALAVHTK
jgi:uncharacterized protein YbjT (DUF2867 family)